MEIREFATRILSADSIEEKLLVVREPLTDQSPGAAVRWTEPTRPPGMHFRKRSRENKLPPFHDHKTLEKRAVCLHRFANHELLAVEIMAFALVLFPDAPKNFRKGLLHTLIEEQEHVRLYIQRLKEMGVKFGDFEVYKHFWSHTPYIHSPIQYVSMMSLTFEMANLDFAPLYGQSFARNGDEKSAQLMDRIARDEIAHVRFGWKWLQQFKGIEETEWEAWNKALPGKLSPKRAKGFVMREEPRLKADVSSDWIALLKQL